ncbi:MAG TPA: hypothetical protein VEU06_04105 [Micropepsaceae bacterium]|jgi:hypothetical protein|nr:hypothetical protein [Micropepsaceae bacterium]
MTIALEQQPARRNTDRIFFTGMALAAALTVLVGFAPSYFMRSAELPELRPLYQIHGAVFTCWILLLIAQTSLVSVRRTDIHRKLGVMGAVLAAAVFTLGVTVSIETLRRQSGGSPGLDPRMFLSIPLGDIIAFGVLVTTAVVLRRRSDWHKRLMLLATISVLTAAVARGLAQVHAGGPVGLFLGTDVFVAVVIVYDFLSRGRVHPATLFGAGMVALFKPALFAISGSTLWLSFAEALR